MFLFCAWSFAKIRFLFTSTWQRNTLFGSFFYAIKVPFLLKIRSPVGPLLTFLGLRSSLNLGTVNRLSLESKSCQKWSFLAEKRGWCWPHLSMPDPPPLASSDLHWAGCWLWTTLLPWKGPAPKSPLRFMIWIVLLIFVPKYLTVKRIHLLDPLSQPDEATASLWFCWGQSFHYPPVEAENSCCHGGW